MSISLFPEVVDTELPAAAALADATANPTIPAAAANGLVFNGTTWDRVRSANSAAGGTGTGVPAAGILGHDGTNYQKIKTDTNGAPLNLGQYLELSGTMAGNGVAAFSQDARGYARFGVQITGVWAGFIQIQGSNDNSNWVDLSYSCWQLGVTTPATPLGGFITANGYWVGPIVSRYFRVYMSTRTSGTATATAELFAAPADTHVQAQTVLPAQATLADSTTNFTTTAVGNAPHVYNGGGWDRVRDANTTNGAATSIGLQGIGAHGYDGSRWRGLNISNAGVLSVRETCSTSTLSNVASSASSTALLASNANRRQAIIYNDSTAVLYVKLGATASATSYSYQLTAGGVLELPMPVYTGGIDGIWASANGNARVTELT